MYFGAEFTVKAYQLIEISFIYGLPLSSWHKSTGVYDVVVTVLCPWALVQLSQGSQRVGDVLGRLDGVAAPWNACMEEVTYTELHEDKFASLLVGVLFHLMVAHRTCTFPPMRAQLYACAQIYVLAHLALV